jgi:hypothetical protein
MVKYTAHPPGLDIVHTGSRHPRLQVHMTGDLVRDISIGCPKPREFGMSRGSRSTVQQLDEAHLSVVSGERRRRDELSMNEWRCEAGCHTSEATVS